MRKKPRILLIGFGEIGIVISKSIQLNEGDFMILSRRSYSDYKHLNISEKYIQHDLSKLPLDPRLLVETDVIIYAAGTPDPSAPLTDRDALVKSELKPLEHLCDSMKESTFNGSLIYISSGGTVYGRSEKKLLSNNQRIQSMFSIIIMKKLLPIYMMISIPHYNS